MNKRRSVSFLIIVSILVLALKDSAGFMHTLLHYIPDNPFHSHAPVHTHSINPMEMHKYLQHKHAHTHAHPEHAHTHDVMDHFHSHAGHHAADKKSAEDVKLPVKTDLFFQQKISFHIQRFPTHAWRHYTCYIFFIHNVSIIPLLQPPQA